VLHPSGAAFRSAANRNFQVRLDLPGVAPSRKLVVNGVLVMAVDDSCQVRPTVNATGDLSDGYRNRQLLAAVALLWRSARGRGVRCGGCTNRPSVFGMNWTVFLLIGSAFVYRIRPQPFGAAAF
jgi:hypothetical protein